MPPISCRCRRRTSWPTPKVLGEAGVRFLEGLAAAPGERAAGARADHHRSARASISRSTSGSARPTRWRRSRRARSPRSRAFGVLMTDTCINYQTILPPVRGEHLAMGDTGVVDLFEQRVRRAQQFRGRALGARRRADRPHAALRLSSRRMRAGRPSASASRRRRATSANGARSAASSAAACGSYWEVPVVEGHRDVPGLRRAEAFRRGAGELRFGGAVPHARHHRPRRRLSAARRRRRGRDRPRRDRRLSRRATTRPATRSMSWCSPRRSCR